MSLILEALRKSEAERRRGLAPDVAMELPPVPAARTRTPPAWTWPALAVAVFAIAAAGWWMLRGDRASASSEDQATAMNSAQADGPPAPPVVVRRQAPAATPPAIPIASTPTPLTASAPIPPATDPPAAPLVVATTPPPRPVSTPVPAPIAGDVPDLDATGLPPVKLTMHMWDEVPARRFVILDGQRMAEGDRSGGLSVVEIRRDGVVVERDGQRARVPLP